MRLKKILRQHGIPWSPTSFQRINSASHSASPQPADFDVRTGEGNARPLRRSQRFSTTAFRETTDARLPFLPTEVLLRVLRYALISNEPILDPLGTTKPENMTMKERTRGNKVAIGFLATCKALHAEGQRIFWSSNSFVFTDASAVRNFAELDLSYRKSITHIIFRITAKFYDDEDRKHFINKEYHPSLTRSLPLRVIQRTKELTMSRRGFRCYAWAQLSDFLDGLRPPFDPRRDKKAQGVRLLPNLQSMFIDFVNFPDFFLPDVNVELHEMTSHELGCTLNELIVTGLPCCEVGMKAGSDLTGMVRDGGLFVDGSCLYVGMKTALKPLMGYQYCARVIRPWRLAQRAARRAALAGLSSNFQPGSPSSTAPSMMSEDSDIDGDWHDHWRGHGHANPDDMPCAPEDKGHPVSRFLRRKTIWKLVPKSRDLEEREWLEFDHHTGHALDGLTGGDISDHDNEPQFCMECGMFHGADPDEHDDFF